VEDGEEEEFRIKELEFRIIFGIILELFREELPGRRIKKEN